MRFAAFLAFVFAFTLAAEAQESRQVPSECLRGSPAYDGRKCQKAVEEATRVPPGKFCALDLKSGYAMCAFDEVSDCLRIAFSSLPDGQMACKPNTDNWPFITEDWRALI